MTTLYALTACHEHMNNKGVYVEHMPSASKQWTDFGTAFHFMNLIQNLIKSWKLQFKRKQYELVLNNATQFTLKAKMLKITIGFIIYGTNHKGFDFSVEQPKT